MAKTAGERAGWALLGALTVLALIQPGGCNTPGDDPVDDAAGEILVDVWPEAVEPTLRRASEQARELVDAVEAWSAAVASGDGVQERESAQQAWLSTMDRWQEAELMQLGPAGSSLKAVGGEDLRDEIYSWPTVNRCRVDQVTVRGEYLDPGFFTSSLVNSYGLDALETLLFTPDSVNHCPPQVDINSEGTFDALGAEGVRQARAAYAVVAAEGVADTIEALIAAWDPDGGDFAGRLADAGGEGSPFASKDQAINAIFDALFYLETGTKDRKLANPLGLRECVGPACVGDIETTLAGGSNQWILANLRGFRTLFTGGEGAGMDDLLRELGHGEVATAVLDALDTAEAAAEAFDLPIDEALESDPGAAIAVHDAVKGVTDLLKGDLATLLQMQIPQEAAGDND